MRKIINYTLAAGAVILSLAFAVAAMANRNIDNNYTLRFSTTLASGTFSGLKGAVAYYPENPAQSKIDVSLDAATINTGNGMKDKDAKSADWLNTAQYPQIKFMSTAFSAQGKQVTVTGNLQLHGVTKQVAIPFTYTEQNGKGVFAGSFTINRADYNINGPGLKAKLVGDKIKIEFNIPTTKI